MNTFSLIRAYFVPRPPKSISDESKKAMKADIEDKGMWSGDLDDANRRKVDPWIRHGDIQSRAENRDWLEHHAKTFAIRWSVLSLMCWVFGFSISGMLVLEVPFVLCGYASSFIAMVFWWLHFRGNSIKQ